MIVYWSDMRAVKYCRKGTQAFFKNHDLDWSDFLKNGIDAQKLIDTNDFMALAVVEYVKNGRK